LLVDPPADLNERAYGAEAVFAGVIPDSLDMTVRTLQNVPAEFLSAALAYRAYCLDDVQWKIVTQPIRFKVFPEYLLDDIFHTEPEFSIPSSVFQALCH
jgi:hypothetical protein